MSGVENQEFASHRAKVIEIFHNNNISKGTVFYQGGKMREEPYTGSHFQFLQEDYFYIY